MHSIVSTYGLKLLFSFFIFKVFFLDTAVAAGHAVPMPRCESNTVPFRKAVLSLL